MSRAAWQAVEPPAVLLCADDAESVPQALVEAGLQVEAVAASGAGPVARELVGRATHQRVVWVGSPDGDPGLTDALAAELSRVAMTREPPAVEVLVGSHDLPGARLLDLVAVMDRLRSPGGCPWDAEQTPHSLVPYLVEEAYEAVEAIEAGEPAAVREELGDVLLQVVFHARMAQEDPRAPFDVDDVAAGIVSKLVSRHPHVFAATGDEDDDVAAGTASDVQARWDELKAAEKGRESVLDGVPAALPALARAEKVLGRLERVGAGDEVVAASVGDPLADELLAVVRRARADGRDPEGALRHGLRVLEQRYREQEARR